MQRIAHAERLVLRYKVGTPIVGVIVCLVLLGVFAFYDVKASEMHCLQDPLSAGVAGECTIEWHSLASNWLKWWDVTRRSFEWSDWKDVELTYRTAKRGRHYYVQLTLHSGEQLELYSYGSNKAAALATVHKIKWFLRAVRLMEADVSSLRREHGDVEQEASPGQQQQAEGVDDGRVIADGEAGAGRLGASVWSWPWGWSWSLPSGSWSWTWSWSSSTASPSSIDAGDRLSPDGTGAEAVKKAQEHEVMQLASSFYNHMKRHESRSGELLSFHFSEEASYFDELMSVIAGVVMIYMLFVQPHREELCVIPRAATAFLIRKTILGFTVYTTAFPLVDVVNVAERPVRKTRKRNGRTETYFCYGIDVQFRDETRVRLMCNDAIEDRARVNETIALIENTRQEILRAGPLPAGGGGREGGQVNVPDVDEDMMERYREHLGTCCICLDRTANMVFVPCGHLVCCSQCHGRLGQSCPICRQNVQRTVRVFV